MTLADQLKSFRIILASQSPRRQEILKQMGLAFDIQVKPVQEVYPQDLSGPEIPAYLAKLKAEAFEGQLEPHDILITSDTIVWCHNTCLGKPKDFQDAKRLLKMLSGKSHEVYTAVCLHTIKSQTIVVDCTKVYFRSLSDADIEQYITECQPYDKAGAYGVQDWIGLVAIYKMEGSYYNVMGLPSHLVYTELEKISATINLNNYNA